MAPFYTERVPERDDLIVARLRAAGNAWQWLVFTRLGAQVDDAVPDLGEADQVFSTQRAYDFVSTWGEVVRAETARADGGRIKEAVVWNTQLGFDLTVDDLVALDRARARLWRLTQQFFATHDVLVTATAQVLPFDADPEYPTHVNGRPVENYLDWMRAVTLISATGCPAISVPGGFSRDGLPIGIQIVAAPGKDVELLRVAHAFEAVTGYGRQRPPLGSPPPA